MNAFFKTMRLKNVKKKLTLQVTITPFLSSQTPASMTIPRTNRSSLMLIATNGQEIR